MEQVLAREQAADKREADLAAREAAVTAREAAVEAPAPAEPETAAEPEAEKVAEPEAVVSSAFTFPFSSFQIRQDETSKTNFRNSLSQHQKPKQRKLRNP